MSLSSSWKFSTGFLLWIKTPIIIANNVINNNNNDNIESQSPQINFEKNSIFFEYLDQSLISMIKNR